MGWRASHSRLVEFSTPAEGVAFDATALVHAAWCLNPRSKPLRQALDLLVSSLHDSRPFRLLSPEEQAWAKRLMHDEWEETE